MDFQNIVITDDRGYFRLTFSHMARKFVNNLYITLPVLYHPYLSYQVKSGFQQQKPCVRKCNSLQDSFRFFR